MKFVYTTYKDKEEALKNADKVIDQQLAVCVDMWPIDSVFPWKGEKSHVEQVMVMFTTDGEKLRTLKEFIQATHSYKVPLIAETDIRMSDLYQAWAEQEFNR